MSHHGEEADRDRQVVFILSFLMHHFFVRIGALAEVHVARCSPQTAPEQLGRGRRVIARTVRGVELGEIVGPCGFDAEDREDASEVAVRILRPTTDADELLIRRLERHKREAVEACRVALVDSGSETMLLDVDQLFDGGSLVMHFLGPVDEIAESVTKQIAESYESVVRSRHFSKLLRDGCGPDCGTEKGGCDQGCAGCSVSCRSPRRPA